jgi:hypothetical protein
MAVSAARSGGPAGCTRPWRAACILVARLRATGRVPLFGRPPAASLPDRGYVRAAPLGRILSPPLLLLPAHTCAAARASHHAQCTWDSHTGGTFDLTALSRAANAAPYVLTDGDIPCTKEVEKNYTYAFNVCQDLSSGASAALGRCAKSNAAVMQVGVQDSAQCYIAGTTQGAAWSLLDPSNPDPSQGVRLTYGNGDVCHHDAKGNLYPAGQEVPRQTSLLFVCSNDAIPNPTAAVEKSHCVYEITLSSYFGCPKECPVGGAARQLCGGHGVCAYDKTNARPKCFCDTGFAGADCATADSGASLTSSGTVIGLLVTVFLLSLVLIGVLVFLVRQIRAYRKDATNYMAIRGGELTGSDSI